MADFDDGDHVLCTDGFHGIVVGRTFFAEQYVYCIENATGHRMWFGEGLLALVERAV